MTEVDKIQALGKIIRDAGISGVTSDRVGPFDRARAEAVIAAGWVSPEEHAEYVEMEGRFSELLCDLTDGLLSKTNYDVRAMVQQVEATFEKYTDDARAEAWDEGYGDDTECNEPRINPYRATEETP